VPQFHGPPQAFSHRLPRRTSHGDPGPGGGGPGQLQPQESGDPQPQGGKAGAVEMAPDRDLLEAAQFELVRDETSPEPVPGELA